MPPYDDLKKETQTVHHRMQKWLEQVSQHRLSSCLSGEACWIPSSDIHETENTYHVLVDLSGIDPSTIHLVVEGNVLCLSGERVRKPVDDCKRIHQLEIDYGAFRRAFQFPLALDPDGAQSSYRHGILEIILPKLRKATSVQVRLQEE